MFSVAKGGAMRSFTGDGGRQAAGGESAKWTAQAGTDASGKGPTNLPSPAGDGLGETGCFVRGKLCLETEIVFANNLFNTGSLQEL